MYLNKWDDSYPYICFFMVSIQNCRFNPQISNPTFEINPRWCHLVLFWTCTSLTFLKCMLVAVDGQYNSGGSSAQNWGFRVVPVINLENGLNPKLNEKFKFLSKILDSWVCTIQTHPLLYSIVSYIYNIHLVHIVCST